MGAPTLRLAMDCGPCEERRATSRRRVSSPSAAKMGAARSSLTWGLPVLCRRLVDILLDVLHLLVPAFLVAAVGFQPACQRDALEPGFHDREPGTFGDVLEFKNHQSGRLGVVIDARLTSAGMPTPRQDPFRLHAFDGDLEGIVLVAWMSYLAG